MVTILARMSLLLRQGITVLCLLLMVWALVAPIFGASIVSFSLPTIVFLPVIWISFVLPNPMDGLGSAKPLLLFVSPRAPPL